MGVRKLIESREGCRYLSLKHPHILQHTNTPTQTIT